MGNYTDFSQLKRFKPAEPQQSPTPAPQTPESRALDGATSSQDYFSSLLGPVSAKKKTSSPSPRRTTVVTPNTVARVREEQAAAAAEAVQAAHQAEIEALKEELAAQEDACTSLAQELNEVRASLEETSEAYDDLRAALEKNRAAYVVTLAQKDDEIKNLKHSLEQVQNKPILPETKEPPHLPPTTFLSLPTTPTEKFEGEIREHVLEALVEAARTAGQGGRERRAQILESVLCGNSPSGELQRRRETVKKIVKDAGSTLDDHAIAELERLGFRYVSGNKHHKLDWAGIRFPLAKTPSDHRASLNSASEINNRVF